MWRALIVLVASGCTKDAAPDGAFLVSELRRTLADREARLHSFRFEAESREGDAVATHRFAFRSPSKLRGVVLTPTRLEWSFDGQRLYKVEPDAKRFTTYELKLPAQKASVFLATTFQPFVSEGFRTPLLPIKGVKASKVAHPKGPEAVALKVELGPAMSATYVLRWPSADFLSRTLSSEGQVSEQTMESEQCDEQLKLCLPRQVRLSEGGTAVHLVTVTGLELNPDLPADGFSPAAPAGWETKTHQVVEAD